MMENPNPSENTSSIVVAKKADSIVTVLKNYVKGGGRGFRITEDTCTYELTKIHGVWRFTKTSTVRSYLVIIAQIEFEVQEVSDVHS